MSRTLVFTLALNGYQWRYRQLIQTHKCYAKKHGYEYVAVSMPRFSTLGLEVAWLKIKLIQHALQSGYDWVVFLDADTRVRADSPAIPSLNQSGKVLYMGEGFSGRINSGVIIIKNSVLAKNFFTTVMSSAMDPIPKEDDVGWGENGHIIHHAKDCHFIARLDKRWNNNEDATLNDYIRHYSRGPLHCEFKASTFERLASNIYHYSLALLKRLKPDNYIKNQSLSLQKYNFNERLDVILKKVQQHYPQFR